MVLEVRVLRMEGRAVATAVPVVWVVVRVIMASTLALLAAALSAAKVNMSASVPVG